MKSIINIYGRADSKLKELAKSVALETIKLMGQPDCFELTIKFVSENEIKRLNCEFRSIDKVTDVLSFPATNIKAGEIFCKDNDLDFCDGLGGDFAYLGDMAICTKQLFRQAKEFDATVFEELKKLVIHSVLHLFGYDHIEDSDYIVMHKNEEMIDKKIKIWGEIMAFKSGFVAVIGKPNVGKSSLVNSLVGQKVSITSPKVQTTRNRIFGIKNTENYQMIFVDTPGVQHTQTKLGEYMTKATEGATADVDAIVIVLDALRVSQEDFKLIEKYEKVKCPIFVVINKIETTNFEKMYPILNKLNGYSFVKKFLTTSAIRKLNIPILEADLAECLPESEPFYPTDEYTDKSVRFMSGEIVREKALLYLQEEIPHGIAVDIVTFDESGDCIKINANIITESDRHKQIIIGSGGTKLKQIGIAARRDIEELTGRKVMLDLFVKVKKDWKDDSIALTEFGFSKKDL